MKSYTTIKLFNLFLFIGFSSTMFAQKSNVTRYVRYSAALKDSVSIMIWRPEGKEDKPLPVIYMNDGQNVFTPSLAITGDSWEADVCVEKIIKEKRVDGAMIVAIAHGKQRFLQYLPEPVYLMATNQEKKSIDSLFGGKPFSDQYLSMLVNELKPWVDQKYATLKDKSNTFIMGSSMGGLISLYAVCKYPNVFGAAACLSTHWPASIKFDNGFAVYFRNYVQAQLPFLKANRFYFDYGTATLDSLYPPYQLIMDKIFAQYGFTAKNYYSRCFKGAEHNEAAWRDRLQYPMLFLLKPSLLR